MLRDVGVVVVAVAFDVETRSLRSRAELSRAEDPELCLNWPKAKAHFPFVTCPRKWAVSSWMNERVGVLNGYS